MDHNFNSPSQHLLTVGVMCHSLDNNCEYEYHEVQSSSWAKDENWWNSCPKRWYFQAHPYTFSSEAIDE